MTEQKTTKSENILYFLFKWVLSVFYFVLALLALYNLSFLSAFLFLLIILFIFPPFSNYLKPKIPLFRNKVTKIVLVFVFGIIAFVSLSIKRDSVDIESDKKQVVVDYIKSSPDKSIQNMKELEKIGNMFNNINYAVTDPKNYNVSIMKDSIKNVWLLTFDPKFTFKNVAYLNNDKKRGTLNRYILKFEMDSTEKILSKKTIISYSKGLEEEFSNESVPDYNAFLNEKEIKNNREDIEMQSIRENMKKEFDKRNVNFEKNCISPWDGSHRELVNILKRGMNDPSSFEHEETRYKLFKDYAVVIMSFRGKNAFGGTVLNSVTAKVNLEDCSVISIEQ